MIMLMEYSEKNENEHEQELKRGKNTKRQPHRS